MIQRHLFCALWLSALLLAGCGGGGDATPAMAPNTKGNFTAIVSFGDSLSDVGTYTPATSVTADGKPPYVGGRFTTNGPGGTVWVENLAASLGLTVNPAEVGFNGSSVKCPIALSNPSLAATCTAYGQGGSRVTVKAGIGQNDDGSGALTVPVVQQLANHLARFGSFKSSDLVLVYAGNNDVVYDFAAYGIVAETIQQQLTLGMITSAQAVTQLAQLKQAAEGDVTQAANDLAGDIKTQIVAKGGVYVAVMLLSDIADTPFGHEFPADLQPILTDLAQVFNAALRTGLDGVPVKIIDTFALSKDVYLNPAKYGFVNNTTPACDVDKISAITGGAVDDGSSLFCNDTPGAPFNGLTAGADPITWQFADSLHPTTGGHRVIAATFQSQLQSFGWI